MVIDPLAELFAAVGVADQVGLQVEHIKDQPEYHLLRAGGARPRPRRLPGEHPPHPGGGTGAQRLFQRGGGPLPGGLTIVPPSPVIGKRRTRFSVDIFCRKDVNREVARVVYGAFLRGAFWGSFLSVKAMERKEF